LGVVAQVHASAEESMKRFQDPAVARVFDSYPPAVRSKLLALRELIFDTAAATDGVGTLQETLKWGEPAYLTVETKSGSTVRIDWKRSQPSQYAMYFHCQTNLIEGFRARFPKQFIYEGNRALVFKLDAKVPMKALRSCVAESLTYHLKKRSRRSARSRIR
jgi:hypothetical protein